MKWLSFKSRITLVLSAAALGASVVSGAGSTAYASPTVSASSSSEGAGTTTFGARCDDGTRIRNAPVSGTILGLCYSTHLLTAICYRNIAGQAYSWIYLTDNTTGVTGWAYGQYIYAVSGGTTYPC